MNDVYSRLLEDIQEIVYAVKLVDGATGGVVQFVSNQVEHVVGYKPAEFIQNPNLWFSIIRPEDHTSVNDATQRMIKTGKSVERIYRIRHKCTGEYLWIEDKPSPQFDAHGRLTGYVGVARDITERKLAEHHLHQLSAAVEQTADAVIITDGQGIIQYVNAAFEKESGYAGWEAIGKTPRMLKSGMHEPRFYENLWKTITAGCIFRAEFINKRKNGEIYYAQKTITPLRDKNGNITHFVSTAKIITDQVLAERALRESKEQYQELFETTSDLIQTITPEGKILYVNRAWRETLGYTEQEVKNLTIDRVVHPSAQPQCLNTLQRALRGEKIDRIETLFVTKQGKNITVEGNMTCRFAEGKSLSMTCFLRDVTERKKAEELNLRMGRILDESINEIYVFDAATLRFVQISEGGRINLGYSMEELKLMTPLDLKPEFTPATFEKILSPLRSGQRTQSVFETIHRRKNGTLYPVEVRLQFARSENPPVFVAIIQDITERKKAETKLRQAQERYKNYFEENLAGAFISTPEGKLLACNPAFARIFRFASVEEALTADIVSLYPRPEIRRALRDRIEKEKKVEYIELPMVRRDGTAVHLIANVSGRFDDKGRLSQMQGYFFDDTQRRELEQQLLHTQKLDSLGMLASGIAHDFNNILSIVMGHASLLLRAQSTPEKLSQSTEAILKATQRGAALVKQLMTFARKTEVVFESVLVNNIIQEMVKLLTETFPKTILISTHLTKELPSVVADTTQIHQVLLNLCVNARDAMPNGGTLTITTTIVEGKSLSAKYLKATAREYILVQVADTGSGMDETTRQKIFEPFFTTKGVGKGTGIGLALVYSIVENHHGFIDVASEIGKGTIFDVYLPVQERSIETDQVSGPAGEDLPGGDETILLIEDEEMLRELVKSILVSKGYTVLSAVDGEEGIALYSLRQQEIAAVVTDMGLPKIGGDEVFKRIKAINPKAKIILASGSIDPGTKSILHKAGATYFIQKPYSPNEVLNIIRNAINAKT